MAYHTKYWSCTPFADWVRGTPKGGAKTSEDWDEWNNEAKRYNSVRYWLAEEGLSYVQDFVTWPIRKIYDIKYYINNRWVSRTHSLTAHARNIKPGQWCDVGNRFLPCLFNELVDFVEIEQAWHHICWDDEAKKKFQAPFWASGWFRWRVWRCPEAGLAHLDWASTLVSDDTWGIEKDSPDYGKPTHQAVNAKEIKELYIWWTTIYRNRPDPHDASGWTDYCEMLRIKHGNSWIGKSEKDDATRKASTKALELLDKIEKAYELEDEEMMIRLIKVRNSLWT